MGKKTEDSINVSRTAHGRDTKTADLDALIDSALDAYTTGEPPLNLSARILAAAHAVEPRQRPGLKAYPARPWTFAAAGWLAAAAMLLIWIRAHNLQIVVQPIPAAQRAQSTPPILSPFPATVSFKSASEQRAPEQTVPRTTHFQHAIRASIFSQAAQRPDRADALQPIAFAPIVISPIDGGEGN